MPRIVSHDERRDEIARAAWRCVAAKGVENVTLRDIGRDAGWTTGALTHYFAGKDEIIAAALQLVLDQGLERLDAREPRSVSELYALLLDQLPTDGERLVEWRAWASFRARTIGDPAVTRQFGDYYEAWERRIERNVATLQAAGALPTGLVAPDVARRVIALCDWLGVQAALAPEQWPAERLRTALRDDLTSLLGAPAGDPAGV